MSSATSLSVGRMVSISQRWVPDIRLGLQNLMLHRLRSLLTMLGMIFGVAAVVSMLSIGAGARQRVMAVIDRKSTRLNSSHVAISYAVFCLKKTTKKDTQ